jgi:DNA-binding GntR family transcriptional regulator
MLKVPELTRVSTVDAIVNALREMILTGALPAGSPLREAELCAQFGVSRHSLRSALQTLVQMGLAHRDQSRSVVVTTLTPDDVEDVYRLRSLLEEEAVEVLSRNKELLGPVREALDALLDLPEGASWTEVRDADLTFHAALVDALQRPRTSRVFASLVGELRLAFLQVHAELEQKREIDTQHRRIMEAIESGDPEAARRCVREHLDAARHDITAALTAVVETAAHR